MTGVVDIKGKKLGSNQPLICCSLISGNLDGLLNELDSIMKKQPDFIEWRADFYKEIHKTEKVIEAAKQINKRLINIPLIFTIRSKTEGGESISLSEEDKVNLLKIVCETKIADIIDFELENDTKDVVLVESFAKKHDVKLILSYHNFRETPNKANMLEKLFEAENKGADIAKLAVMPNNMEDVISLINMTHEASNSMTIPIITMSMGQDGALTRLIGWKFGSAMTFAVGNQSSAPGQIPIEFLHESKRYL